MGTDWSPVGQIYFYTLRSTNPEYDVMNLKSLETWVIEKNLKSVPGVVDTNPFGGPTREYQVRLDPDKLVTYGLSIAPGGAAARQQQCQWRRQLHPGRQSSRSTCAKSAWSRDIQDIENTVITTKSGTPLHVKDIAEVDAGAHDSLGPVRRYLPQHATARW